MRPSWKTGFALLVFCLPSLGVAAEAGSRIVVATSLGEIVIQPDPSAAPKNVEAFCKYVSGQVYQNSNFDQTGDGYIQGGKPGPQSPGGFSKSGNFSSSQAPAPEFGLKNVRGAVGLARTVGDCNPGKTSNSTQFYICLDHNTKSDGEFSVFGHVVEGLEVAEKIAEALKSGQGPVGIEVKVK